MSITSSITNSSVILYVKLKCNLAIIFEAIAAKRIYERFYFNPLVERPDAFTTLVDSYEVDLVRHPPTV